ncbi:MAG: hypothetical protein P1U68_04465 [Verrucomicrobiales bacterium]|nr:hypothetical protein [Verrucomicrobiales bacterium]
MKSLSHFLLGMSVAGLFMLGCERHQFEETKILHGDHGHHGEDHADSHGEHGKGHGDEGHQDDAHGDHKAHADEGHHAEKPEKTKKEEPREVGL